MKKVLIVMLKRISLEQKAALRSRFGGHAGPPPTSLKTPTPLDIKVWGSLFCHKN